MFKKKKENDEYDPVANFMHLLNEEFKKEPKLCVRIERLPQGSMENCTLDYVPAIDICHRNFHSIEVFVADNYDCGDFLICLVDSKHRPLKNVQTVRILTGPIKNDDIKFKLNIAYQDLMLEILEYEDSNKKVVQKMLLRVPSELLLCYTLSNKNL